MLKYLKYDNINVDKELLKIQSCKEAEIVLEPNNKKCLFILGMLFVNGVKIKIINENDLNLEETNKSFTMMPYVWSRLGDTNFNYSNAVTDMEKRVANVRRLGFPIIINRVLDKPIINRIFLICPVRIATPEQRKWIEDFTREKQEEGYIIHAPHLHTVQEDLFGGYAICRQNAEAISSSEEVDIYYDQRSTGSVFDLGVAYALRKPLKLLNKEEIIFDRDDLIDNIVESWPYNNENIMTKTKKK